MTTPTKTSVQVIQELISLQSSKLDKLTKSDSPAQTDKTNDPVIKKLLQELSQFGDAVDSTVAKDDPYYSDDQHQENSFQQAISRVLGQGGDLPQSIQDVAEIMKNN